MKIFTAVMSQEIGKPRIKHRPYHSWQLLVFRNPADFTWNLADFIKSSGFHEIWQILWNPADFMKSWDIAFPLHCIKLKSFSWIIWFIRFASGFHMKPAGFHEICQISCEIHQISHEIRWISWNLPNFMNMSFCVIAKYRSFFRKTNKLWSWKQINLR